MPDRRRQRRGGRRRVRRDPPPLPVPGARAHRPPRGGCVSPPGRVRPARQDNHPEGVHRRPARRRQAEREHAMTATTVSQAVEKRDAGIVNVMWDNRTHFAAVLPDHIDVKSFLGTAAAALYASPALMNAAEKSSDSLITAIMLCAALGHQPGTDEYYLTPRTVRGRPVVLGIEGYRGLIERMYRSGAVKTVIVREVCAK